MPFKKDNSKQQNILFSSHLQKILAIIILVYIFGNGSLFHKVNESNPLTLLANDFIEMRDLRENRTNRSIMYGTKEDVIKKGDAVLNLPPDIFILNKWTPYEKEAEEEDEIAVNAKSAFPFSEEQKERNKNARLIRTFSQAAEAAKDVAVAFTVTGDEKYAEKGVQIITAALLGPGSRNIILPMETIGWNKKKYGLMDLPIPETSECTLSLITMTDAIKMLNQSNAMDENTEEAWQNFCFKYSKWLLESEQGKKLVAENDIYGTMAKVRLAVCADCGGRTEIAVATLKEIPKMLDKQLTPAVNGKLRLKNYLANIDPASETPLLSCMQNTEALFIAARLGISEEARLNFYNYKTSEGLGLNSAADCILPYISTTEKHNTTGSNAFFNGTCTKEITNFADSLHLADRYLKNHRYEIHGKLITRD